MKYLKKFFRFFTLPISSIITFSIIVSFASPLSATIQITSTQCICGAGGSGSIEIEATGEAGPFTFEWIGSSGVIDGATDQNLTEITEAGFYSVIVSITGMVLAIPTYTVIRVVAREFLNRFEIVQRITSGMKKE